MPGFQDAGISGSVNCGMEKNGYICRKKQVSRYETHVDAEVVTKVGREM